MFNSQIIALIGDFFCFPSVSIIAFSLEQFLLGWKLYDLAIIEVCGACLLCSMLNLRIVIRIV
jgi:hypothetical protein